MEPDSLASGFSFAYYECLALGPTPILHPSLGLLSAAQKLVSSPRVTMVTIGHHGYYFSCADLQLRLILGGDLGSL